MLVNTWMGERPLTFQNIPKHLGELSYKNDRTMICFIIFLCVQLKFFSVSFVPLLAPNPGDATVLRLGLS